MSEPKICNLDLIAPIQPRKIVLGKTEYEVEPLTVESFIEFNKTRQTISKSDSVEEGLRLTKGMIKAAIPSMPDEVINSLTLEHLQYIILFINDEIPEEILNGKKEEAQKPVKAKGKKAEKTENSEGK